jgi:predicted transcriptional regulator
VAQGPNWNNSAIRDGAEEAERGSLVAEKAQDPR